MRQWRDGDGAIGEEDIVFFLSQVVRGKIGGRKPATVAERIRAAAILLKLYENGALDGGDGEEDALSAAIREFEEEGRGPGSGRGFGGSGGSGGLFGEEGAEGFGGFGFGSAGGGVWG